MSLVESRTRATDRADDADGSGGGMVNGPLNETGKRSRMPDCPRLFSPISFVSFDFFPIVRKYGKVIEFDYGHAACSWRHLRFCRREDVRLPLRLAQDLMSKLGATGGPRSWQVCGLFVDMLGILENESVAPFRTVETPYGVVTLMPRELALVERVLAAFYPQASGEALKTAKQMMASSLIDPSMDWSEAERLAGLKDFKIGPEFQRLKAEVENG